MFKRLFFKPSSEFWIVAGIFAAGLCLRLWGLGDFSLQENEISTARRISHSFWGTITHLQHASFPPLHFIILQVWSNIFGTSEWALRFPSALYSALTVIVIYKLGKELFNKETGWIAALLLASSSFAVGNAQDAKMYALFYLLEAVSFLYFFRFVNNQQNEKITPYVISTILCCYTMYTGLVLLLAQNVIYLMSQEKAGGRKWVVGQAVIVASFFVWVLYSVHEEQIFLGQSPGIREYVQFCLLFFMHMIGVPPEFWPIEEWRKVLFWINITVYSFLIIFFVSGFLTKPSGKDEDRNPNHKHLLIWTVSSIVIYCVFDALFTHLFLAVRYLGFMQLPLLLLFACQFAGFPQLIKKFIVMTMVLIAVTISCIHLKENTESPNQDWRRIAKDITRDLGEHDIVLSLLWVPIKYYYKGDPDRFFMVTPEDCSTLALIANGILTPRVDSIFVFYKNNTPILSFDGFVLAQTVTYKKSGYMRFQRKPPESLSRQ